MFEFLHAADLHLDTQPSGLHGYPDDVARVLRDASLTAFGNLVNTAIERRVAFCVFAGDIYDGADRGTRAELAFRRGLVRLAEAGIRSLIVHGNHDPVEEGFSTVSEWPEEVTVFGADEPGTVTFEVGGTSVAVHGISYARRDTTENLALRFERHPDAQVQIGVLHTNVGHNGDHAPYAPCSLDDLRSVGLDYWALGHIHARQNVAGPGPWVVYPGNTQGRHSKASEQGAKGAVIVAVSDGATIAEPQFVALDTLRFVGAEVSIDALVDIGELNDELERRGTQLCSDNPGRALVIRATLSGSGPLHSLLVDPVTRADLLHSVQEYWSGRSPVVFWDDFSDSTTGEVDLDALSRQDDFTGVALRTIASFTDDPVDGELDVLERLSPSLGRLGVDLPDTSDPELIRRARTLAAELLTGGGR